MSEQPTPSPAFAAPVPESNPADTHLFRVNPMSYIVLAFLFVAVLGPIAAAPAQLFWLLLLPLAFGWWVARTRTRVDESGIRADSWRGSRTVGWDDVKGVMFPKRGFARLVTTSDTEVPLGGVSFHDLPRLSAASRGRIRDPYSA